MYPHLLDQLAREHRNDLLRDADRDRLALLARISPTPERPSRPVTAARGGRRRLGLLLVAAGTRLLCPPHQPC